MASLPIDRRLDLGTANPGAELVGRLHDIPDLVCRLVGDRVGLTAILDASSASFLSEAD
jgi:hypothetical protein